MKHVLSERKLFILNFYAHRYSDHQLKGIETCKECPEGTYPHKVLELKKFLFDNPSLHFKNECFSSYNKDLCTKTRGWNFQNSGIYTGNHNFTNFKIILTKNVTIIQDQGQIEVNIEIKDNISKKETIYFDIDGRTHCNI